MGLVINNIQDSRLPSLKMVYHLKKKGEEGEEEKRTKRKDNIFRSIISKENDSVIL